MSPPNPGTVMLQNFLFMSKEDAASIGTSEYTPPSFEPYESDSLRSVGLCEEIESQAYPFYLPRPFNINFVQATAVRLALVQYFISKGWKKSMGPEELITTDLLRRALPNKNTVGGFIIGDGTGVGKTRELAAFLVSVVLYEKAIHDTQCHLGPLIFRREECASVMDTVRDGRWRRAPFFIWLTCSKPLFRSCQEGIREVLTNSGSARASWKHFSDRPLRFMGGGGAGSISFRTPNVVTEAMEETLIMFYTLKDIKDIEKTSGGGGRKISDLHTSVPSILFMTYADLNVNLQFVLRFISGGANIDANVSVPMDNILTAVLCDEFHVPKNISDPFRKVLQDIWAEEDNRVLSDSPRPPNPSLSDLVERFKRALCKDKQFTTKCLRSKRKQKSACGRSLMSTGTFLSLLRMSDSFRLFLEVIKHDTFCLMASATPFQSNADLHSVDHILRRNLPAYTSIAAFSGGGNYSTPDMIAENSEYATVFLEQVVKLLKNRGQLVSRCISIANVECSVVNCNMTPMQQYAIDELSSYCLSARQTLVDSRQLGEAIADALSSLISDESGIVTKRHLKEFVDRLNSPNAATKYRPHKRKRDDENENENDLYDLCYSGMGKIDKRFRAVVLFQNDVAHDGYTSIKTILSEAAEAAAAREIEWKTTEQHPPPPIALDAVTQELMNAVTEEESKSVEEGLATASCTSMKTATREAAATDFVFGEEWFTKLGRQYYINIASTCVAACKNALLSIKSHAVCEAVQSLRLSPEPKKAVMSLEQTGDSFLTGLAGRIFHAPGKGGSTGTVPDANNNDSVATPAAASIPTTTSASTSTSASLPNYGIVDLSVFDSSPLANIILAGYRLLCRAVAIATAIRFKTSGGKQAYLVLVPVPPPMEPFLALSGNAMDIIAQRVGDTNHAEITNRKLCCRITGRGMMSIRPNHKTSDTNECVNSFNNTTEVDTILLGPKGSTGLSLHDSRSNAISAKRVHCVIDLPYNAIAFLQTIGRTHRNGQMSTPHYIIFSTDFPGENRFFDSLEKRIKDSKAGTFADRYSGNSVSIGNGVDREQFLDKGLVLKTMGFVIRVISSDMTQTDLMDTFAKTMMDIDGGAIAFMEGLDESNDLFLEIVILALHITLVALDHHHDIIDCPESLARAMDFEATLEEQTLYSVAAAATKFAFSNLCLNLAFHREERKLGKTLLSISRAASSLFTFIESQKKKQQTAQPRPRHRRSCASLFPAGGRDTSLDMFSDLVTQRATGVPIRDVDEGCQSNNGGHRQQGMISLRVSRIQRIEQIVCSHSPANPLTTIAASNRVCTVRVLGTGHKEGVVPSSQCIGVISTDIIQSIPVVTACSVLNTLSRENPGLVLDLHNASLPHMHFNKSLSCNVTYILNLARKLSKGSLDFRQFQNNFFSPKSESRLLSDTFNNIKTIMARDDRLDGLCEVRMNNVMGASYARVRRRPECVFITKLLDPVLRRHVVLNKDRGEDKEDGKSNETNDTSEKEHYSSHNFSRVGGGEGHDLDVILCSGLTVRLTKENSAFVKEHIDSFVAGNLIGRDGSILQLCFDNCNGSFEKMPKFCLYDPSFKVPEEGVSSN
nr:MAG: wsv026-like protein [Metapenaeus ensis nimavirus]